CYQSWWGSVERVAGMSPARLSPPYTPSNSYSRRHIDRIISEHTLWSALQRCMVHCALRAVPVTMRFVFGAANYIG
ncbi:MAG TPA: hypothetical protein VE866_08920, partial [Candidatus Binatia bacterium]|nr:hypothetical protein [Candidatus Binatia bacterium]